MTFYVNMGRAVDLTAALQRRLRLYRQDNQPVIKKSIVEKLGLSGYLRALFTNPKVGASYPLVLQRIVHEGHELGLHGGRNHGAWQASGLDWPVSRLKDEVVWGVQEMRKAGLPRPESFASPGWVSPLGLPLLLRELGFTVLADMHDPECSAYTGVDTPVQALNTNLLGEPGGVGWFESMDARGIGDNEALSMALKHIDEHSTAILYDHPCYMVRKIGFARQFIKELKSNGVCFLTAQHLSKGGN
ncbi:MAG: peptidoglycan/xylan/chitin deacetylase (PgdA/CDA1 family) [Alloalcanivorax sp.]|jgi:peptidoglycan/xylan/chitin deacetylase (PgdA/CDA1 family)